MKNEVIIYKDGELELPVEVTPEQETVWLNRSQLAILFDRDVKTIGKHINNALKEELDSSTVAKRERQKSTKIYRILQPRHDYIRWISRKIPKRRFF